MSILNEALTLEEKQRTRSPRSGQGIRCVAPEATKVETLTEPSIQILQELEFKYPTQLMNRL